MPPGYVVDFDEAADLISLNGEERTVTFTYEHISIDVIFFVKPSTIPDRMVGYPSLLSHHLDRIISIASLLSHHLFRNTVSNLFYLTPSTNFSPCHLIFSFVISLPLSGTQMERSRPP